MSVFGKIKKTPPYGEFVTQSSEKCYKVLTFSGRYKQEVVRVAPNGYTTYDLVMSNLKFVWECKCMTEEEAKELKHDWTNDLVPLPPTTGPTAQPAGENYWQSRDFSWVMDVKPTDVACGMIHEYTPPSWTCIGKMVCELPDPEPKRIPGACEGKPCVDRHIPLNPLTGLFRCTCSKLLINVAREMLRDNPCDPNELECYAVQDHPSSRV